MGARPGPAFGRRLFSGRAIVQYDNRALRLHILIVNSLSKIHRSVRDIRVSGSHRVVVDQFSARLSLVQERA